jgi:CelD/BcsL family acetyltransferase involved in cellulose biosynthesis
MSSGEPRADGHPREAALTLRKWSLSDWLASEGAWQGLLARSHADHLFLSWEWLTLWWQCFGDALGGGPEIQAFYRGEELVGIAPLYRRRVKRGLLHASSVQLIGLSWRDAGAPMISEYLDVVAMPAEADAVRRACVRSLTVDEAWTECVIGFTAAGRQWRDAFAASEPQRSQYLRDLDRLVSYQADLSAGFDAYLRALGRSTRRSLWNLRRRLGAHGEVSIECVAPGEIDSALQDLNRLHQLRWGKPAFTGARLSFHQNLARHLAGRGELAVSRLRVAGTVVSVLYDIRKGVRQYNINMGFDPNFSGKLSLGLLHLGYAMERAAERTVAIYDFLAGPGQHSDYKRYLSQSQLQLSCVQVLRGRVLPPLYQLHDRLQQRGWKPPPGRQSNMSAD